MTQIPDGYVIRAAIPDDVVGVAAVLLADDLADTGASHWDEDFVRDQWSTPGFDLSTDAWVVEARNGDVVAHANVMPDGDERVKSWGIVHPEHRGLGIGSALVDRIESRASDRLRGRAQALLDVAVTDTDAAGAELVRARGFELVRSFRHMQLDLDGPLERVGPPPSGIVVRGIEPERDLREIHATFVDAFRDEWGYRVIPFEEWSGLEVETSSYDPSLWHVATEGDRIVGGISGSVWGDRGWVGELGVRPAWRKRGIASTLLSRAFATFAERGLARVMLNVDADNPTGATRLYERVGMRSVRGWDVYEKSLS